MRYNSLIISSLLLIVFLFIQGASGHVPVTGEPGESLESAIEISDPTKSFVIYSELQNADEANYFVFEMTAGTRLRTTLMIPTEYTDSSFRPTLVLMGPGITNSSNLSAHISEHIEIPTGVGVVLFDEVLLHPEYEGFTPSSFLLLEDVDIIVPGTGSYYLAIYDETSEGRYAITIGYRETFTIDEWILVPVNVITIHQWEGQLLALILAPLIGTVIVGSTISFRKSKTEELSLLPINWIGSIGSWFVIGSGISIFYQMLVAAITVPANAQIIITAIFGALPILLGYFALQQSSLLGSANSLNSSLRIIIIGVLSLFVWGGLIIGPVLVILAGIITILQSRQS